MAKKTHVSHIPTPSVNKAAFQSISDLPSTETANDLVSQVTGQPDQHSAIKKEIDTEIKKLKMAVKTEAKGYGRPVKEKAIGRVKFTTALRQDVVKWLKHYAIEADETAADILENALLFYKNHKEGLKG